MSKLVKHHNIWLKHVRKRITFQDNQINFYFCLLHAMTSWYYLDLIILL